MTSLGYEKLIHGAVRIASASLAAISLAKFFDQTWKPDDVVKVQ